MVEQGFWSDQTLLHYFENAVQKHPDQLAIVDTNSETQQGTRISYRELSEQVDQIALALINLGIQKQDVVSFQLPNWWQFTAIHLACLKVGAISNPLMPIFRQRELIYMLGFAESKLLIIPDQFRGHDFVAMMEDIRPDLPALRHIFAIGGQDDISFEKNLLQHDLKNKSDLTTELEKRTIGANDVIQLVYTSGTTGKPKGVMHTSNTILSAVHPLLKRLKLDSCDTLFMGSPLAHQTGFLYGVIAPIVLQTKVALLDIWSAKQGWQIIQQENASFTMASTPFLSDLVASPVAQESNSERFKTFVCGGAPIPRAIARKANQDLNLNVISVWGMSENGAVTSSCIEDDDEKIFNTDGKALDGMEVRVIDTQGNLTPTGQEGLLQARGAFTFVGYLKQPQAYLLDADGWFDTGDLAKMDKDQYIRISGRTKDIIIRGGENIPVVEVENLLYKHDAIQDVAVVAMPHERLGEIGCCFITLMDHCSLNFDELKNYLAQQKLAKNYWPERLEILNEIPRTPSGKIQKFQLRALISNKGNE
ncbi:MAG: cyclohexanecarboxylate-CoA ligase [Gammaproteobacteria bacterium]|nr:MAG: cyclohexanecarboxylate-CoA ligase [Gammaproteobacteria bacterium]